MWAEERSNRGTSEKKSRGRIGSVFWAGRGGGLGGGEEAITAGCSRVPIRSLRAKAEGIYTVRGLKIC